MDSVNLSTNNSSITIGSANSIAANDVDFDALQRELKKISMSHFATRPSLREEETLTKEKLVNEIQSLKSLRSRIESWIQDAKFAYMRSALDLEAAETAMDPHYSTLERSLETAEQYCEKMKRLMAGPRLKEIDQQIALLEEKLKLCEDLHYGRETTEPYNFTNQLSRLKKTDSQIMASPHVQSLISVFPPIKSTGPAATVENVELNLEPDHVQNVELPNHREATAAPSAPLEKPLESKPEIKATPLPQNDSKNWRVATAALLALFLFGMAYLVYCKRRVS